MANSDFTSVHSDDLEALLLMINQIAFTSETLEKQIQEIEESIFSIRGENTIEPLDE